jgi:hypothetical protein
VRARPTCIGRRSSAQEYLNRRAEAEVDAVVAQYGDVALAHFARPVDLDPERLRELKRLAEQG